MKKPNKTSTTISSNEDLRTKVLAAAAKLIAKSGQEAATTRAIAAAANVQAPLIYRLFGDKRGLLDAVAERSLAAYMNKKATLKPNLDPIQELRDRWDTHIAFSLANPELFAIMSGNPLLHSTSPAVKLGLEVLQRRIKAIAVAGYLRVSEEQAIALVQSTGVGIVLVLLSQPKEVRDLELAVIARESVIGAITTERKIIDTESVTRSAAITLRASLDDIADLSQGEKQLLDEWLIRISNTK